MNPNQDPAIDETTANIGLVERFLDEVLDNDALRAAVPSGSRLVLIPADDDALARSNLQEAFRLLERGEAVRLQLVGGPPIEQSLNAAAPASAPGVDDVRLIYDHRRDMLLVDFAGSEQPATIVPVGGAVVLRVDARTRQVTGVIIRSFLASAVERAPDLAPSLLGAEFRELADAEVGAFGAEVLEHPALSGRKTLGIVGEALRSIA